jgi:hypothetical protein
MLHVYVLAYALFLNPTTGDEQLAGADLASPIECADVLNAHQVIETADYGTYYMVKAECQGVYVDDDGNIISHDGDGNK